MTNPAMDGALIRVFLVDDHEIARAGVRSLLGDAVEIIGEADQVEAAIELIREREPDVVLVDVHMPGGGGKAVVEAIHSSHPDVAFLVLSVSDAAEDVLALIRSGAKGYATKDTAAPDLLQAVRQIHDGKPYFSPKLAGLVLESFTDIPAADVDEDVDRLTAREVEVLRLIARGYTYKEIAERLFISPKTVEGHVSSTLRKTQSSNRTQLTRWAVDHGLD